MGRNNRKVYLDYAATTPVKQEVLQEMIPFFAENFGNPSSIYSIGMESKQAIDHSREQIAKLIGARPEEVYFTAGGTESDNWALKAAAEVLKGKGNHIITTAIEHPAILNTCRYLEENGFVVTYLKPDREGFITPEQLEKAIRKDTILISVMTVNNEIGTIEPIKMLAKTAHEQDVFFHTDGVQALGSVPVDVKKAGVDMLSMSSHKIYGPKGIGALYVRRGIQLPPFIHGGEQESGKRAGTENLPGIVGFGKAAEFAGSNIQKHRKHCIMLRDRLIKKILQNIPDAILNGPENEEKRHPGNVNITFRYTEGESLLLLLDACGISVSTGSACSSRSFEPSHVLTAVGIDSEDAHSTIRMTVGDFTEPEDIDYTVECLIESVFRLRELSSLNPL